MIFRVFSGRVQLQLEIRDARMEDFVLRLKGVEILKIFIQQFFKKLLLLGV